MAGYLGKPSNISELVATRLPTALPAAPAQTLAPRHRPHSAAAGGSWGTEPRRCWSCRCHPGLAILRGVPPGKACRPHAGKARAGRNTRSAQPPAITPSPPRLGHARLAPKTGTRNGAAPRLSAAPTSTTSTRCSTAIRTRPLRPLTPLSSPAA